MSITKRILCALAALIITPVVFIFCLWVVLLYGQLIAYIAQHIGLV